MVRSALTSLVFILVLAGCASDGENYEGDYWGGYGQPPGYAPGYGMSHHGGEYAASARRSPFYPGYRNRHYDDPYYCPPGFLYSSPRYGYRNPGYRYGSGRGYGYGYGYSGWSYRNKLERKEVKRERKREKQELKLERKAVKQERMFAKRQAKREQSFSKQQRAQNRNANKRSRKAAKKQTKYDREYGR